MIFDILLYAALIICITGVGIRVYLWVKKSPFFFTHPSTQGIPDIVRLITGTIFSRNIRHLAKSMFIDLLFQHRIIKASLLRWCMHGLIFFGFTALILMHAMDSLITERFFPYYYSTLNPFFFLRSLFGLMVLAGTGIAVYRRYIHKPRRLRNNFSDLFLIVLILMIVLSGVLLEGMKMTSVTEFTIMVEDYAGLSYDDEEAEALEAYWVRDFALKSDRAAPPFDPGTLALGMEVHESSCMDCHSPNQSAFLGYAAARLLSPVAVALDKMKMTRVFYYLHILSCFLGLALIPLGKMFHVVAVPASLLAGSLEDTGARPRAFVPAKQKMELDACTHCCTCNLHCSAGMILETLSNEFILPSEKMQALKRASQAKEIDEKTWYALFQGIYLCTGCDRCTVVCPSGIHIKSIWRSAGEHLTRRHDDDPLLMTGFSFSRSINPDMIKNRTGPLRMICTPGRDTAEPDTMSLSPLSLDQAANKLFELPALPGADTFSHCFGCQGCSAVCPVVALFDVPEDTLTLMPHQIMYSLGLGLTGLARETAMMWNCLSCYQCQENCPQDVHVCDILFILKNQTFTRPQDGHP